MPVIPSSGASDLSNPSHPSSQTGRHKGPTSRCGALGEVGGEPGVLGHQLRGAGHLGDGEITGDQVRESAALAGPDMVLQPACTMIASGLICIVSTLPLTSGVGDWAVLTAV